MKVRTSNRMQMLHRHCPNLDVATNYVHNVLRSMSKSTQVQIVISRHDSGHYSVETCIDYSMKKPDRIDLIIARYGR